jgi:hypothetical protein
MTISKLASKLNYVRKSNCGLVNQDKSDPINRLIPLHAIPLSGNYVCDLVCDCNFLKTVLSGKTTEKRVTTHFYVSLPPNTLSVDIKGNHNKKDHKTSLKLCAHKCLLNKSHSCFRREVRTIRGGTSFLCNMFFFCFFLI